MSDPSSVKPPSIELKPVTPNMEKPSETKNKPIPEIKVEVAPGKPEIKTEVPTAEEGDKSEEPKSKEMPSEMPKRAEGDGGSDLEVNEPNIPVNLGPFGVLGGGTEREIPDLNFYQHKKTLGKGMMDLALFSANANQLRYVLECADRHPYYYPSMILIIFSLICQVAVGFALLWNSMYNIKLDMNKANKANNYTVIGIFLVTVVNVFISAFGVANPPPLVVAGAAPPGTTAMALVSEGFGDF